MTYDEVGGCRRMAGFSMENVRFKKPGDSHATLFFCSFLLCEKGKRQTLNRGIAAGWARYGLN